MRFPTLQDEGLVFDTVRGEFVIEQGRVEIRMFELDSTSYAISASGELNFREDSSRGFRSRSTRSATHLAGRARAGRGCAAQKDRGPCGWSPRAPLRHCRCASHRSRISDRGGPRRTEGRDQRRAHVMNLMRPRAGANRRRGPEQCRMPSARRAGAAAGPAPPQPSSIAAVPPDAPLIAVSASRRDRWRWHGVALAGSRSSAVERGCAQRVDGEPASVLRCELSRSMARHARGARRAPRRAPDFERPELVAIRHGLSRRRDRDRRGVADWLLNVQALQRRTTPAAPESER